MNRRLVCFALLLVAQVLTALAPAARAAEPADRHVAIYPYLGDDVIAVAFVDVTAVDFPAILALGKRTGWIDAQQAKAVEAQVAQAEQLQEHWMNLGLERMYAIVRMSDVQYSGSVIVIPVAADKDPEEMLTNLRAMPAPLKNAVGDGKMLLVGMNEQQVEQFKATRSEVAPRQEALDAIDAVQDSDVGVLLFGDADSRRVVREMLPPLPAPFAEINGKLIADDLAWAGVSLKLPPQLGAAVEIQANSSKAAEVVSQSLVTGLSLAKNLLAQQAKNSPEESGMANLAAAIGKLHAKVEQDRVTLSLGDNPEEIAALVDILAQPIREARQYAFRNSRMNNFKQITRAMLNYESANGSYPPQAILSEDGKPLLSWRVAILPYLDQQALYDQFHLDEPWDSEHNLKLSQTVVPVYQDPDSGIVRKLKEPWYTTYLGVAGKGTIFDGREGTKIKDVIDGTSNTVMIVEVTPERAVPWSKPADWEVDFKKPFAGVESTDRDGFVAGFADGHAGYISTEHEQTRKNWPKMLTIGGEELIEW